MNIWYINHYANNPETGVPGRPFYLARGLERMGHNVLIVCAHYHHLNENSKSIPVNKMINLKGQRYIFLESRKYKKNDIKRILNMFDFAKNVKKLNLGIYAGNLFKPDVIIGSCAHIFTYLASEKIADKVDAKCIYEVRDIWPLSLVEVAGKSKINPIIFWMSRIEKKAYRKADAVVSLLSNSLKHMEKNGLDSEKFFYIPNGIEIECLKKEPPFLEKDQEELFKKLKKSGKLIVIYTGSMGPPNPLDQIINLNSVNNGSQAPYHFILIGDGVDKDRLQKRIINEKIEFVSMLPKMSYEKVRRALNLADVGFEGARDLPIYQYGLSPNKLFDYFLAGLPVLYSVNVDNDPVTDSKAGIVVKPEDLKMLHNALIKLVNMTDVERKKMGEMGRAYVIEYHDWNKLSEKYSILIDNITKSCRNNTHNRL